jgi:ACS family tartrate transporter-like MFS transporter
VLGAAEAGFFPGVLIYLSEDRAKATSNFMAAIPLSSVVGAPFAGWILSHQWTHVQGWRWLFLLEGLPAVVLAVVAFFFLTDRASEAKWLSVEQRQWLTEKIISERSTAKQSLSVMDTIRSRMVLLLTAACFFSYLMYYAFLFYFPTMLKAQSGLSDQRIGILGMLPFFVTFVAMQINGWHSDRSGERHWHATIPLLVASVALLMLMLRVNSTAITLGLFVLVSSSTAYLPVFWAIPTEKLGSSVAPTAVGLINGCGSIAGFIGPYAFGDLKTRTGTFTMGLLMLAGCAVLASILILKTRRPEPGEE